MIAFLLKQDENSKPLHIFLHHLMNNKNGGKLLSIPYNHMQPKLYIKYNPEYLLEFLKKTDQYNEEEVYQLCKENKLYDEMVYILDKKGNKVDTIIDILINMADDFERAIKYTCKFNTTWDKIFTEAQKDPKKLNILIKYIDFVGKQGNICLKF